MRVLNAVQEQRAKAALISTVPLVKLELYSDRDAGTVGATFHLSNRSVMYKYGTGSAIRFEPWLQSLGDLESGLVHIADSGDSELIAKRFSLTLRNILALKTEAGADAMWRVIEILRETYAIEGGSIEVAQILVPKITTKGPLDLSAYTGDEHTVFYRGRISRLGPISEREIQLQCETDEPAFKWGRCGDPTTASPRDLGTRYPRPYGSKSKLPCPGHTVGWATTLAEAISATKTGLIQVTDTTGFPTSGTFYVQIEGEQCTCDGSDTDTGIIDVTTRGSGSTSAASHPAGATVVELPTEAIYIVADDGAAPVADVTTVYVRNPFNGQLVRISGSSYTFEDEDTTVDSGKTVSTITFSQANLQSLYTELFENARVSTQAVWRSGGSAPSTIVEEPDGSGSEEATTDYVKLSDWTEPSDLYCDCGIAGSMVKWKAAYVAGQDARNVLRWRLKLRITSDGTYTGTQAYMRLESGAANFFPTDHVDASISKADGIEVTVYGDWHTPTYGITCEDLQGDIFKLFPHPSGAPNPECYVNEWGVEAEVENTSDLTRDVDSQIEAAGLGYDLEVFADVQGTEVPALDTEWDDGYDCDDDTGWSVDNCTRAQDTGVKHEGTASQKMTIATTVRLQCESADGTDASAWASNAYSVDSDEGSIVTEGSGSIKLTSNSTTDEGMSGTSGFGPIDLTAGDGLLILVDVRVDFNGASGGEINLQLGNTSSDMDRFDFADTRFTDDTWHTVIIDYDATPDSSVGSFDPSAWDLFRVRYNNGSTKVSGMIVYIDNIRTIPKMARMQKNSISPTLDITSDTDSWRFYLRTDSLGRYLFSVALAEFDNTAGSGTTMPSPHQEVYDVTPPDADTFTAMDGGNVASGDSDAVQTIQFRMELEGDKVASLIGDSVDYYFDILQAENNLPNPYSASPGAMMEKPADIVRHWCVEVGGLTVDETSFAAALTNLGSNKLAVDMRQLTPGDWRTGAAGLGFHSRANIVPKETAAGTVYCLYTAESDYDWPAFVEGTNGHIVTAWQTFGEAGPQGRELFTRFAAFYGFDASGGAGNERDFHSMIRGDEDDNDLTVPSTANFQAAANKFGTTAPKVFFFPGIEDDATAKDVLGYYAHEAIRAPRIFLLDGCFWWEVYELEEGDLVQITHPWSEATIKARVLGYTKRFATEANSLRCLEVE
jgi:hypothetical protein